MFYLETLKRLYQSIKENNDIGERDKRDALEHINKLINILALY